MVLQLVLMDIEILKTPDLQEYLPAACAAFCQPQDVDKDLAHERVQLVARVQCRVHGK